MTTKRFSRFGRRSSRLAREVREAGGAVALASCEVVVEAATAAEERDAAAGRDTEACRRGAGCRGSMAEEFSAAAEKREMKSVSRPARQPVSGWSWYETTRLVAGRRRGNRGAVEDAVVTRPVMLQAETEIQSHKK
jgi:hypothetical protein